MLYTVVNSSVYADYTGAEIPGWMMLVYGIDGVLALILIAVEAGVIVRYRKKLAAK